MKKGLIIIHSQNAVGKFRIENPNQYIIDNFSDKITLETIDIRELPIGPDINYEYDFIFTHITTILSTPFSEQLIKEKKRGVKIIFDIDDYWEVPETNPAHIYFKNSLANLIPKALSWCDGVTTTTEDFRKLLLKWNKNVIVIPNLITTKNKLVETTSSRLRIGLLCGSSHLEDIKILTNMVKELKSYQDKIQWVLCGFDTRNNSNPELSTWNLFEQILTDDYSILDKQYKETLLNYVDEGYPDNNKPYVRRWSKPFETYHELYSNLDVLLCPLVDDKFNQMKSELKAIEAGTYNKLLICSDVGIYKKFKHNEDCLKVNKFRPNEFVKNIKKLLLNPSEVDRLKENLNKRIKKEFDNDLWSMKRIEFYNKL